MRHRMAGRHLGRDTAHRTALYRNLVTDLLRYERITTTEAKAKEIRPMAERVITLGKRGDLHARRQALRVVYDEHVVRKVFDEIAERMRERPGGYLRITGLETRKGDGAKMAAIELVDLAEPVAPAPRPARAATAAPPAPARGRRAAGASPLPEAPVAVASAAEAELDTAEAEDREAEDTSFEDEGASEAPDDAVDQTKAGLDQESAEARSGDEPESSAEEDGDEE